MEPTSVNGLFDGTLDAQCMSTTFLGGTADLMEDASVSYRDEVHGSSTPSGVRLPLAMTAMGDRVWVVQIKGGRRMVRRLTDVGIVQGSEITVVSRTEQGSIIVAFQGCRIGLGAGMAHRVMVTTVQQAAHQSLPDQAPIQSLNGESAMPETLTLSALTIGQSGRIVGYEKGSRAYRQKLMSMGLTPGIHFTLTRQAPMGDPIEIEVRGYKLSLRRGEAAALKVEAINAESVGETTIGSGGEATGAAKWSDQPSGGEP